MNQLEIALSIDMLKALMDGEVMSVKLADLDLVVSLRCDPLTIKSFRDTIDAAMLEFLPGPLSVH